MSIGSLSFQGGSVAPNSRVPSSAGPSSAPPEPAATPTVIQPQRSNVAANMASKVSILLFKNVCAKFYALLCRPSAILTPNLYQSSVACLHPDQPKSSQCSMCSTSINTGHLVQIKVVCSSGGKFTKVANGIEYQGGETRLIAVSNFCSYQSMLEALERVTGSTQHAMGNSNNSELVRTVLDFVSFMIRGLVH